MPQNNFVLIRGGGDLASGVALRLYRAGIRVLIAELPRPLAVRRAVSFSEAVYEGRHSIEGVQAKLVDRDQFSAWKEADVVPVIVDQNAEILKTTNFPVVVDARLLKQTPEPLPVLVPLHIGLGPGFVAGKNCHAVVETRRSHTLGRVYWNGSTQPDSGEPEGDPRRVLRAPHAGIVSAFAAIGDHVKENQVIAEIHSHAGDLTTNIVSPFTGVLRGLIRPGMHVTKGLKIGDVDARNERETCFLVSDKSLAIGGGALEAILTRNEIREIIFAN